ncbi:VanZ family protein [Pseudalkalibacillus sp. A8]|uniref:VanZ family protein n=1 Tax=Pseudalkalibacillus sp. A8 TaxID=3382641 RepID=UPI0038B5611C
MKKLLLYWGPVLIWMGMIFYSSSQPYSDQDIKPLFLDTLELGWVTTYFSELAFNYAGEEVSVKLLGEAGYIEFFIRKGAHVTVYLILAFLIYRALRITIKTRKPIIFYSWLLTSIYAASDEIHQGFTVQRSPHVEDVILDSFGAILGVLLAHHLIYKKVRKQNQTQLTSEKN